MANNTEKLIRYLDDQGQLPENISIVTGHPVEIVNRVIEGKSFIPEPPKEKKAPAPRRTTVKITGKSLCERNARIRQLAGEGRLPKELSAEFHLPLQSIHVILAGKTPSELKEERNLEMIKLFENGETLISLQEKYGLSYNQVYKICSKRKRNGGKDGQESKKTKSRN